MSGTIVRTERCHAITRRRGADTRCKHMTSRSTLCWQHLKANKGLRIMKSELPGAGKGLFTTKPIPRGAVIAKYTGDVVVEMDPDYGNPYALKIKDQPPTFLDASRTNTAEGRWVNDARNEGAENAELHYDKQKKQGYLEATRDIEAGEEIYTDYGPDYWENKATIPDLKKRREKRADAVKVVEELQDDGDDGYAPEPVAPPRVRKHIAEPEPQYEEPAPKPAPKPRAAQKNARILPPREKAPPNTQYRKGLIARLRMMQMMLASEKFVKELGLKPTKKSFTIPDAEMNTEGLKELEAVEKAALKQLLAHFNTGKANQKNAGVLSMEKLVALVDALVKKHGVAKLQGAGFNLNRSIFNQF